MKRHGTIVLLAPVALGVAFLASLGSVQSFVSPDAATMATRVAPRQHGPIKVHRWRPDRQVDSENWSGYAVTGTSFTQALGSWTVPEVNCSETPATRSTNAYASFWVGIDGYTSSTVEQIGTDSDCDYTSDGSVPIYYAWYEFYPANAYEITGVEVSPGNQISAEVSYSGSEFTVEITNETTGQSFSKTESIRKAKRTSAEWIAEAPCCARGGNFLPLSDFGTVSDGGDYTGVGGTNFATNTSKSGPIASFGPALCTQTDSSNCVSQINMVTSSGAPEDTSSSLTPDGTSFQVTWDAD